MRWLHSVTDVMDISLSRPRVGDRQGSLICCSPLGCKELDLIEQLNRTEQKKIMLLFHIFFFLITNFENEDFKKIFLKITKYISILLKPESVH